MKTKTEKTYVYNGLGFPIVLHNVKMVEIEGHYHPKIDVQKIADEAIKELISQRERLSGNQIKFIRSYFSMSLRTFAKLMNESHMAVKKWEDYEDKATNMDPNIEKILRLNTLDRIAIKEMKLSKEQSKQRKIEFYDHFAKISEMFIDIINQKKGERSAHQAR